MFASKTRNIAIVTLIEGDPLNIGRVAFPLQ
jgi:hypothetical protein